MTKNKDLYLLPCKTLALQVQGHFVQNLNIAQKPLTGFVLKRKRVAILFYNMIEIHTRLPTSSKLQEYIQQMICIQDLRIDYHHGINFNKLNSLLKILELVEYALCADYAAINSIDRIQKSVIFNLNS